MSFLKTFTLFLLAIATRVALVRADLAVPDDGPEADAAVLVARGGANRAPFGFFPEIKVHTNCGWKFTTKVKPLDAGLNNPVIDQGCRDLATRLGKDGIDVDVAYVCNDVTYQPFGSLDNQIVFDLGDKIVDVNVSKNAKTKLNASLGFNDKKYGSFYTWQVEVQLKGLGTDEILWTGFTCVSDEKFHMVSFG